MTMYTIRVQTGMHRVTNLENYVHNLFGDPHVLWIITSSCNLYLCAFATDIAHVFISCKRMKMTYTI